MMYRTLSRQTLLILLALPVVAASVAILPAPYEKPVSALNTCSDVYAPIPQWIKDEVAYNKPFYLAASSSTGVPWEMLAAIHYRETSFSHSNPSNGQGIFQFVNGDGGPYPAGPVNDQNFQTQLNYMAGRIQADYVYRGSLGYPHRPLQPNETDDFRVQDTLYSYNGRSSVYARQGTQYGFNETTQPYEGSPYVMNRFDCARANMGLITRDYGDLDGIDTRFGAFTLYARLKSDAYWQSRYDFLGTNMKLNLPGCYAATNTSLDCTWKLVQMSTSIPTIATSISQRDKLLAYGYKLDGVAFYGNTAAVSTARKPWNIPVYGLSKPDHSIFLTANLAEYTLLSDTYGFTPLGVALYADPIGANSGHPVYRLHSAGTGNHIWTTSLAEKNHYLANGYTDEGIAFSAISDKVQEQAPPSNKSLVYRFNIPQNKTHLWTTDINERDILITRGYQYEGVAWQSSTLTSERPVYRLYAPSIQRHLYTTDTNERSVLLASTRWQDEGVAYYVSQSQTTSPVYRLYAPSIAVHHLTTDANEYSALKSSGLWRDEGIAWYQP